MTNQGLDFGSIFLTIVCAVILIVSICLNLSLLTTLLKVNRLRRTDRSNHFLTHLIFVDLACTILVCIPSGIGIYNMGSLDSITCHVQTYFTTFNFIMTFHGLLLLAIDRYLKFFHRKFHDETFLTENRNAKIICLKTSAFIVPVWILDCFISFIPLFANFSDQEYFTVESQCDFIYENFAWWLWFFFFIGLILPFVAACVLFIITIVRIRKYKKIIRKNQNEVKPTDRTKLKFFNQIRDKSKQNVFSIHDKKEQYDENSTQSSVQIRKLFDIKRDENEANKTYTYFIMLIVSFVCVFPVYVIHFYRTYNYTDGNDYDLDTEIDWKVYTSFAWISYLNFIVKSTIALATNRYYRDALYQAANARGFRDKFHFQYHPRGNEIEETQEVEGN